MSKLKYLKVAGIFVVILFGLSTLVVGMQLSSDSTATTVHKQTTTPSATSFNSAVTSPAATQTCNGTSDLTARNSACFGSVFTQEITSGDHDLRCSP